jgi:sugar-specific transcriptional regulator TrmB
MLSNRSILMVWITLAVCMWICVPLGAENFAEQLQAPIDQSIDTRVRTQEQVDQWQQERARLVARYEELQKQQADLTERLSRLQESITRQAAANRSLETRIAEAENMAGAILPFLETVYPRLVRLVDTDIPFLAVERKVRLDHLKETLDDPQVSASEKFRKTMETLFIEAAYGNTTEVYREQIQLEGNQRQFSVLRVGRIALFCLSPDQALAGYYNVAESKWLSLPGHWQRDLQAAIDMAEKRRPTDLVKLPLGRLAGQ